MLVQEKGSRKLDWKSEIRTWGGAGDDGSAELLASQAPQEEDDDVTRWRTRKSLRRRMTTQGMSGEGFLVW